MGSNGVALRWPVHPRPLDDELLSSWVARVACANALSSDELLSEFGVRSARKIDVANDATVWRALADRTGVDMERVESLSLEPFATAIGPAASIDWIRLPDAAGRNRRQRWCPRCFVVDSLPYVRRSWQLAWLPACRTHAVALSDRCPGCRAPLDVRRASNQRSLAVCWRCGGDLGAEVAVRPADIEQATVSALSALASGRWQAFGDAWALGVVLRGLDDEQWCDVLARVQVGCTDSARDASTVFAVAWRAVGSDDTLRWLAGTAPQAFRLARLYPCARDLRRFAVDVRDGVLMRSASILMSGRSVQIRRSLHDIVREASSTILERKVATLSGTRRVR